MSSRRIFTLILPALALLALWGAGCSNTSTTAPALSSSSSNSDSNDGDASATGLLSVQLQAVGADSAQDGHDDHGHWIAPDSSKLITSLTLTFNSLRVYPASADSDSVADRHHGGRCDPDSGATYLEVLTGPITVEASQLADTLSTTLANANLPAGKYSHLGLRVSAASAVLADSNIVTVQIATRDSLVKVLVPFTVVTGQTTEIQITMHLNRAVHERPYGSGNYYLEPVLAGAGRGPHGGGPHGGGPHGGGPDGGGHGHGPGGGHHGGGAGGR